MRDPKRTGDKIDYPEANDHSIKSARAGGRKLVSPAGLLCIPKYAVWGLPGALAHVWLQPDVVERLIRIDARIRTETRTTGRLLVWDGLRTLTTQRHLYETERSRINSTHVDKTPQEREAILNEIVRPPSVDRPPPHTTGGAVDCTIWFGEQDDALGEFDDFTPRGRSDYYSSGEITSIADARQAMRRAILREAMQAEDFVGIDSEWWHWEYGTRLWAAIKSKAPLFDAILEAPEPEAPATRTSRTPSRYPQNVLGIGQVFATPDERSESLQDKFPGYYYARTRHPNERQLANKLGVMIGAPDGVLFPSGLSAGVLSVWGLARKGARVVIDKFAYYETITSIEYVAGEREWTVIKADLSDVGVIAGMDVRPGDVVFVDHPRNWMLTCPNLAVLRQVVAHGGGRLIVDTSVQPLQKLLRLGLADVLTLSLSKYPSLGLTAGGAVLGPAELLKPIDTARRMLGVLLSPDTAARILESLSGLRDRLSAVSGKAERLVTLLRGIPFVSDVRLPDLTHVDALPGGQITFKVDAEIARRAEQIIATNAQDPEFPFAFACTFGASFTTFEHFDARNSEGWRPSAGSEHIEAGRIRVGIGTEEGDALEEGLRFVLQAARFAR